jgi:hypothetical protein
LSYDEIIQKCNGKNIEESAKCIQKITDSFFKINFEKIYIDNISFEDLKREGGVCDQWANYWCEIGKDLGFFAQKDIFPFFYLEEKKFVFRHAVCIWGDKKGFAILSNNDFRFIEFGNMENLYDFIIENEKQNPNSNI